MISADSSVTRLARYQRGEKVKIRRIKDKKLKSNLKLLEERYRDAASSAVNAEILLQEDPGVLEAEGMEKTWKLTQDQIVKEVDVTTARKRFDLSLSQFGPYAIDYTRNGRHLLLGGRKGHIASFDWQQGKLHSEIQVQETVRDVKWLHDESFYAVAQKKYVYIYDKNGLEVHCLKKHIEATAMEFLPYHYLLATIGNAGYLKYQDTSTGQLVAELRTKLGATSVMAQNTHNAILHVGHANGTVTLWSPNMPTPLVKLLSHKGPLRGLAVDREGRYMTTCGADSQLKIWDIRAFKEVHSYYTPTPAQTLNISETGLLGVGWGPHVSVWRDAFKTKQQAPYMQHLNPGSSIVDIKFCPFEDILGFGHEKGFSSLLIPGSGEANFDALELNPYQNNRQRQETEVKTLLEKLKPEMIALEPEFVGDLDKAGAAIRRHDLQGEVKQKNDKTVARPNIRGKNSSLRNYLRKKNKSIIDERRMRIEAALKTEKKLRQLNVRRIRGEDAEDEAKLGPALTRFTTKQR
ncbi:putative U3 small nucleolar RNA-associated protein 7 [Neolecta irregularis DAH-3]|uniref:U three protein 7 n=1 Tax=Neolecta irregularis (strain DAH-3) TaxID=1198029 RepID=A0A1U7LT52_NEOID|nr:putative U3 small nucleolar RNA-associated protein 7 [Neolecta irregularis DAH-3]|eukprot:OLL25722.1 putative U3 small nucleolar RNA-associated protein 7 [Neolecta irregularis DAH-3]